MVRIQSKTSRMIEYRGNGASTSVPQGGSHSDSETDKDRVSTDSESETINSLGFDVCGATVVTMTNSSHVMIKRETKIIGPVTIHQYPNPNSSVRSLDQTESGYALSEIPQNCTTSSADKAELSKESVPHVSLETSRKKICNAMLSKLSCKLGIIFTLMVVLITVVTIVYFTVLQQNESSGEAIRPIQPTKPSINVKDLKEEDTDLGDDIHIITKKRWGGYEIPDTSKNRTLVHPIPLVIIGHTAGRSTCTTVETCSQKMETIQSGHVAAGYPDIRYNFVIGGDGNIYEGLGWDIRNDLYDNSIRISFVGNYVFIIVTERQAKALQLLLGKGIELGKLDKNYLLTAHSQFESTLSPGINLLNAMKQWPHYNNRTFT